MLRVLEIVFREEATNHLSNIKLSALKTYIYATLFNLSIVCAGVCAYVCVCENWWKKTLNLRKSRCKWEGLEGEKEKDNLYNLQKKKSRYIKWVRLQFALKKRYHPIIQYSLEIKMFPGQQNFQHSWLKKIYLYWTHYCMNSRQCSSQSATPEKHGY